MVQPFGSTIRSRLYWVVGLLGVAISLARRRFRWVRFPHDPPFWHSTQWGDYPFRTIGCLWFGGAERGGVEGQEEKVTSDRGSPVPLGCSTTVVALGFDPSYGGSIPSTLTNSS